MTILETVKNDVAPNYLDVDVYDTDILEDINYAVMSLIQLGIGPQSGLFVQAYTEWDELVKNEVLQNYVKKYICFKVKLLFDPPQSSSHTEILNKTLSEYECRLMLMKHFIKGDDVHD